MISGFHSTTNIQDLIENPQIYSKTQRYVQFPLGPLKNFDRLYHDISWYSGLAVWEHSILRDTEHYECSDPQVFSTHEHLPRSGHLLQHSVIAPVSGRCACIVIESFIVNHHSIYHYCILLFCQQCSQHLRPNTNKQLDAERATQHIPLRCSASWGWNDSSFNNNSTGETFSSWSLVIQFSP